ncbi:MAG: cell division protein ZapA [Oscillospiraceae bacterium]|jgi:cell division protein ZapA (FtsZ GTPase activity inhibitor)|nr:cell division protein ZapA [Oscillospiraceae bacterium]
MSRVRLTLNICGINCTISSEEEEDYVKMVAEEVSQNITKTMNSNEKVSSSMAATLVALEYCDAAKKASISSDNLRVQIKNYLEDIANLSTEIEQKNKEIVRLKLELEPLDSKTKKHR